MHPTGNYSTRLDRQSRSVMEATAAKQANAADNGLDAKLDALFDGYAPPPDLDLDF